MTETNIPKYRKDELLSGLAIRLRTNPQFMAYVLFEYQKQERLTQDDLINELNISPERFAQLSLCKRPDPEAENFALQARKISSVIGVSTNSIVGIIRQVDSLEALNHQPDPVGPLAPDGESVLHSGALAAARDREAVSKADEFENQDGINSEQAPE